MKLCRYGSPNAEKPGLIDQNGALRDLSNILSDLSPVCLFPESLARLASIELRSLPIVTGSPRYGPPISGTRQFIAVGLNFEDHARESGMAIPREPVLFTKAVSSICGPNDDVLYPQDGSKVDWEVELGVVIGSTARYVTEADAMRYVAGFVLINDVSERAFQLDRGGTWDKGKGCETFGPIGPWLVTTDEVGDFNNLGMWLEVNGKRMQDGNTRTMIFHVPELVAYISRFVTLLPGDIITTGTPPGVGLGQKPEPIYLKPGDVMRLGIEKLGVQQQTVVPWRNLGETQAVE